jgi:hypothetical protein
MTDAQVLFCPFCRETFEGIDRCPTHDLGLVPFRVLQAIVDSTQDDKPLRFASLRLGRGPIFVGAALTSVAFFLPLLRLSGQVESSSTLLRLASTQGEGMRLWFVPMSAFTLLLTLYRRRSPAAMRGARLVAMMLALLPSAVVAWTLRGAYEAAARMNELMGGGIHTQLGGGSLLTFVAAILLVAGAARLGVLRARRVD